MADASVDLGLAGLSTFGPAPAEDRHQVNTHLDIFEWRPERRPLSRVEAYAVLNLEIERRLTGEDEPIGILTHHLVHAEASWDFLDELLGSDRQAPGRALAGGGRAVRAAAALIGVRGGRRQRYLSHPSNHRIC